MTKAILINSKPILQDKNLIVKLAVKGKDFLIGGGFEKELEKVLNDFYGQKIKVEYVEELDKE